MRPLLAILLSVFLIAGVYAYTQFANSVRPEPVYFQPKISDGQFSVEITRTFDCEGTSEWDGIAAIEVVFRGEKVREKTGWIGSAEMIRIEDLQGVLQHENNLLVKARVAQSSAPENSDGEKNDQPSAGVDEWGDPLPVGSPSGSGGGVQASGALRIVVKNGADVIADETFWKEPGAKSVTAEIQFEAPAEPAQEHDHE